MPTLIQLSFSHYSRKVAWAMHHAGIEFDARNVSLRQMVDIRDLHPENTVPVLVADERRICGSDQIMRWIAEQAPTADLYRDDAAAWESWADENLGPLARRDAYRTIYEHPTWYTANPALWMLFRAARSTVLTILKTYKARRHYDSDDAARPAIIQHVIDGLGDKPYLGGDTPHAGDFAVAAMLQPMLRIRKGPIATPELRSLQPYVDRLARRTRGRRLGSAERAHFAAMGLAHGSVAPTASQARPTRSTD